MPAPDRGGSFPACFPSPPRPAPRPRALPVLSWTPSLRREENRSHEPPLRSRSGPPYIATVRGSWTKARWKQGAGGGPLLRGEGAYNQLHEGVVSRSLRRPDQPFQPRVDSKLRHPPRATRSSGLARPSSRCKPSSGSTTQARQNVHTQLHSVLRGGVGRKPVRPHSSIRPANAGQGCGAGSLLPPRRPSPAPPA